MDMGFGLFIYFGINIYYDMEWSDGILDLVKFNFIKLDIDQWCVMVKVVGMKYVVFIIKYYDGFCFWLMK